MSPTRNPSLRVCECLSPGALPTPILWCVVIASAAQLSAADASPAGPPADSLDDPVTPLAAKQSRSERDDDRLQSETLYAHGRMLFQRQDFAGALRRYQRAWRSAPESVSVLPEIVFVAHHLQRREEAARYAVLAAERTSVDPFLLRQLALHLTSQQDWQRALRLYEKAWEKDEAGRGNEETSDAITAIMQLEMGRLYFLTDNFPKSAEFFGRVRRALQKLEGTPDHAALRETLLGQADRTYLLFAESFFQAGQYDAAAEMFRKVHEVKPNEASLAFQLARLAIKQGQLDAARQLLDAYFQAKSSTAGSEPYELLLDLNASQTKEVKEAKRQTLATLEQRLDEDGDNVALLSFLAGWYRREDRLPEAERLWKRVLEIQPTADVHLALTELQIGQGRWDDGLKSLAATVQASGSLQPLVRLKAWLTVDAARLANLLAAARQQLSGPADQPAPGVVVVAAWLAFQSRQTADADAWFARAWPQIEPANRERVALNWGLDQILAKRYEAAAAIFQRAIDEQAAEDGQGVLQFYLTRALALVGRHDDALKVAEKAAALHPKSPRLRALPAWVAYHAKRYAAAEQGYRALLQEFDDLYDPPEIREELRDARLLLSNICVLQQRRAEAEEWLEQVLDEFPEDIGALNDLAYLWVEQGRRLQRSLGMLQRAVAGDPDNVAYLDSLGWVHYQLGRYEEAVPHLEKAAAGPEPDGVILEHLGDAYLKLGRREQARAAWQRAVEAFDESGDSARRKETLQKIQRHEQ